MDTQAFPKIPGNFWCAYIHSTTWDSGLLRCWEHSWASCLPWSRGSTSSLTFRDNLQHFYSLQALQPILGSHCWCLEGVNVCHVLWGWPSLNFQTFHHVHGLPLPVLSRKSQILGWQKVHLDISISTIINIQTNVLACPIILLFYKEQLISSSTATSVPANNHVCGPIFHPHIY